MSANRDTIRSASTTDLLADPTMVSSQLQRTLTTTQRTPIEGKVSQFTWDLLVLGSKRYIVTEIESLMPR